MLRSMALILCGIFANAAALLAAAGCASSPADQSATRSISQTREPTQESTVPRARPRPEAEQASPSTASVDRTSGEARATDPDPESSTPGAPAVATTIDPAPEAVAADAVPLWWNEARSGSPSDSDDSRGMNLLAVSGDGDTLSRAREAALDRARAFASDRHGVGPDGLRILRIAARPAPGGGFTTYLLVELEGGRSVNAEAPPEPR